MFDFTQNVLNRKDQMENVQEDNFCTTKQIDMITDKFFRYYQKDMWREFKNSFTDKENNAWTFVAGTGTGKTEVFKFIPPYMIAKAKEEGNKEGLVFGLICHRLCLIQDLKNRILPVFFNEPNYVDPIAYVNPKKQAGCGLNRNKIKYYIVNSGCYKTQYDNTDIKNDNDSKIEMKSNVLDNCLSGAKHVKNMKPEDLKAEIEENRKVGIHSMFISLYQSTAIYHKKLSALNFDFIIGDECHALNTMGKDVFINCGEFFKTVKACYFFTASAQFHPDDKVNCEADEYNPMQITNKSILDKDVHVEA